VEVAHSQESVHQAQEIYQYVGHRLTQLDLPWQEPASELLVAASLPREEAPPAPVEVLAVLRVGRPGRARNRLGPPPGLHRQELKLTVAR